MITCTECHVCPEELSVLRDRLAILLKVNADRIGRDRRTTALEQSLRAQLAYWIDRASLAEERLQEMGR